MVKVGDKIECCGNHMITMIKPVKSCEPLIAHKWAYANGDVIKFGEAIKMCPTCGNMDWFNLLRLRIGDENKDV